MRLTLKERCSVSMVISDRYKKAPKKEKSAILDVFTQLTGYNRAYACWLPSSHSKKPHSKASRKADPVKLSPKAHPKRLSTQLYEQYPKLKIILAPPRPASPPPLLALLPRASSEASKYAGATLLVTHTDEKSCPITTHPAWIITRIAIYNERT